MEPLHLTIEGMHCDACVRRVKAALAGTPGVQVKRVEVGSAEVAYDPAAANAEKIAGAVNRIGFAAKAQ